MKEDAKGFFYPEVDTSACVECGLCEKVCPFEKQHLSLHKPLKAYAAWNKNETEHSASSSGGAAYVFSAHIIEQGGVVYGCAATGMRIRHIRVDTLAELPKLQGSKYVQSDIRKIFSHVRTDLNAGRPVLFIGTPCQVAGLKNFIKETPENLYLIDLICHGVPSQKMLSVHIASISKGREILHIAFRNGTTYIMKVAGKDFAYECTPYWKDAYMRSFMSGFIFRGSCYRCPFATSSRISDITIGDFWGLCGMEERPVRTHDGISVLLPCSEKGLKLIYSTKGKLTIYERQMNEAVAGNTQLQHPTPLTMRNRIFNFLWPFFSFDIAVWLSLADQLTISARRRCIKFLLHGFRK